MDNNEEVSIKINKENRKITTSAFEVEVLNKMKGITGFPEIKVICKYGKYDVVIQMIVGPSLKKLISFYQSPFDKITII